jgi:hypothetical protein
MGIMPAREIKKIMEKVGGKGEQRMETNEEQEGKSGEEWARENFESGISEEGEFAFTRAIGIIARKL